MGLDTVEFLLDVENAFDVRIPDAVAATLVTPGHLIDYLHASRKPGNPPGCLSMRCFHQIRCILRQELGIARQQIQTNANLETLIPRHCRRALWHKLRANSGLPIAPLHRPKWLTILLSSLVIIGSCVFALVAEEPIDQALVFIASSLVLGSVALRLSLPMAVHLPAGVTTLRELVNLLTKCAPARFLYPSESLSREEIATAVRHITLWYCDEDQYRENARFVQDLGLG